jgi:cytochrome c oxidase cbb3-type subunit 3
MDKRGLLGLVLLGLVGVTNHAWAQASQPNQTPPAAAQKPSTQSGPTPPGEGGGSAAHRAGGFVPGQKRPPGDPAQIARGKTLFEINCRGCHGADLRGGDLGGPNLLRSQVALSDQDGELIVPIIQGSRQEMGMPAIAISPADAKAVAAYVRSVIATIGRQGTPPGVGREAPSVLVGNASEGKAYFDEKCGSCHSATGDLRGIATRIPDAKTLQTTWVAGGSRDERRAPEAGEPSARTVTAVVTLPSGESVEGQLVRIDDFLVTLRIADGSERTLRRDGDMPKIVVHDPMKTHRTLLAEYTDKDIHDVTAYLVTLK